MSHLRALFQTGPVGLMYSIKLARYDRRLQRVSTHMQNERDLHMQNMALLNSEMDQLVDAQLRTNVAAGQFAAAWAQASTEVQAKAEIPA